ncbi:P2X purinoceptor 7-like isoform X2 [Trichechus manatus latirostris]|uniref:P2X purinoceptor 7-like isoform X2 n=1 Tax=Trichechus manatus latirostris TaxID=127582 RepID=A0A2Y9R4Y0_TRIMA|nr:P2X purinoceptor 7-like isoform X2 [Trichechus manatus latirostris]
MLLATQTNLGSVWKGTVQGCESQEAESLGPSWSPTTTLTNCYERDGSHFLVEMFVCLLLIMCRRNIYPDLNITCTFDKTQNPQCPIFRLGDIFRETGDNFSDVAIQGGIMGIEIYWDCNLDSWFHRCQPKYSFRRLDDKTTNAALYPGYNFRYAKYYKELNFETRTLIKVFGIRFDILVFGIGGKFDIIQLIVYIGSTLSYFGLVRQSLSQALQK